MKKAILGVAASALFGVAGAAYADDYGSGSSMNKDTSSMPGSDMNKSGSSDMNKSSDVGKSDEGLSNELTGRVVKAGPEMVYVEHMGAVVPLKVDKNTRFEGASIKRAKDLKEGQEIRASFTINNRTENLAKSISLSSATGGSGFNEEKDINHGSDMNKDLNQPVQNAPTTPGSPSDTDKKY